MSNRFINIISKWKVGDPIAKTVLFWLANSADENGLSHESVTQPKLVELTEFSLPSIKRALKFLDDEKRMITKVKHGRTMQYQIGIRQIPIETEEAQTEADEDNDWYQSDTNQDERYQTDTNLAEVVGDSEESENSIGVCQTPESVSDRHQSEPPYKDEPIEPKKELNISKTPIGVSESESAEAGASPPSPAENSSGEKPKRRKPERDPRLDHPAIKMFRSITSRYPPKDCWDKVIREIGDNPDEQFFETCFEIWRSVGGAWTNLHKWLYAPHKTGKPPEIYGEKQEFVDIPKNGNGGDGPPAIDAKPEPLDEASLKLELQRMEEVCAEFGFEGLKTFERHFYFKDWDWIMSKLKVTFAPAAKELTYTEGFGDL